jgi:hypothetical protein
MTTQATIDRDRLEEALYNAQQLTQKHAQTAVYSVTDAERGTVEQTLNAQRMAEPLNESLVPYPRTLRGNITINEDMALVETAGGYASTANFPDLLRSGITFDAFASYNGVPTTWQMFCSETSSSKQQEEYLKDAAMGIAPIVPEGSDYPLAALNLDSGTIIKNHKRGFRIGVTEEMRMFDQVGKMRQIASEMGRSLRVTEESAVYDVLTTSTNYTHNSTTGDNDQGANYNTTTFSPAGLITAMNCLTTAKDRKSGMYLGVVPDTLIVSPKVWWAAKQLIQSPQVMRAHADSDGTTLETYGGGTNNSFFNLVNRIIVSPWFGASYGWALMEAKRALRFQRVYPMRILPPEFYSRNDTWEYQCSTFFGVGMLDDRFAYLSTSTTAPVVD